MEKLCLVDMTRVVHVQFQGTDGFVGFGGFGAGFGGALFHAVKIVSVDGATNVPMMNLRTTGRGLSPGFLNVDVAMLGVLNIN